MNESLLFNRIMLSREYFEYLPLALSSDWHYLYEAYRRSELTLPQIMTLLHPNHYSLDELPGNETMRKVLGDRTFPVEAGMQTQACNALSVWGYVCPITQNDGLAADHTFPYSLGGPTVSSNKRFLCRLHNQMKSNDVHFYPWEEGEPIWVAQTLMRMKRYISKT